MTSGPIIVGISGASGIVYARRLLEELVKMEREAVVIATPAARQVIRGELGVEVSAGHPRFGEWLRTDGAGLEHLQWIPSETISAGPASGSFPSAGMVIVPCSMKTLGAVAAGLADNLLTRAADVCLKEGHRLVVVPRETPFNALHLENMLRLARLGVRIVPPSPAFYHRPTDIESLVFFVVQKIMEQLGLEVPDPVRWTGMPE